MKKHLTKRILALLLTLAMVLSLLPMSFAAEPAEEGTSLDFVVLSTTDMHGKCWDKNVLTDGNENNTMLRVSTAVSQYRETYGDNMLLIDNGDLYQGTPVSTVQLGKITSGESSEPPAMALCLGDIGYDVSVLGNHEFNYPWTTMTKAYEYLAGRGVPIITANLYYDGSDGVHEAGENVFTPYLVKSFRIGGVEHKIGVLGLENTDCTRWDVPDNYPGIVFSHPENPQRSAAWEVQHYLPMMQAEGCEFIIVSYHSGTGSASGELVFGQNTEGQVTRMIAECEGIDMVIAGHDHSSSYSNNYFKDKNGKDVLVVNGGGTQLTQSVFTFSEDGDGKLQYVVKESRNLGLGGYAVDETLKAKIVPYAEMASEYVNQVAGYAVGEWDTSHNYYLEQTDTIDLINDVQKTYGTKYLALKYDTDEEKAALYAATGLDHVDVDVSAASPVTSNNYYVKPGEITMKTIVQMYKYDNNVLYILPLTGQQIKDVLEQNAATRLKATVKNGAVSYSAIGDNFTNVVFGGLNFTYDMYQPEGSRVVIEGLANGREFAMDKTYIVACNSYHLGNTGCGFGAFGPDDSIWNQNNDLGGSNIQEAILEYIQDKGEIDTAPFTWSWRLDYSGDLSAAAGLKGDFAARKISAEELAEGDQIVLYYDADATVIGLNPASDTRRLDAVDTTSFEDCIAFDKSAAVLTVGVADAENGYYTLRSEKGYLTAGAAGNSLGFEENGTTDLAQWKFVPVEGGYHVMSVGANYNGNHNQAIEWYNGFTTYGVKDTPIYLFNLYRLAETAKRAAELSDGRQYVIFYDEEELCVADTASNGGLGSVKNTVSGDFLMLPATEHTLIVTARQEGESGFAFVSADGKYLSSLPSGNGIFLGDEPAANDCSLWNPVPVEGGFHVMNVGANYNGNHNQALEYYGGKFTTYGVKDTGAYLFNFFELAGQEPVEPPAGELSGKTIILHTNDTHGALMGFAQAAKVKADLEAQGATVLLVDAGDYSQGNPYVSLSKGETAITVMNAAGYDYATLGNHEFDY
ncbi:MAG: 5'-nucleotidase C-terminal domain-containing protein, partial [Oscillospiraceae bacterium]|nr:5'-nucleotidase C-terminal domain-containing protein [Oscillospiraceae bacterium]